MQIQVELKIYKIRNQRVMFDSDLAELYGVETKRLVEQVKRNISRFPEDFMFRLDSSHLEELRTQIATTNSLSLGNNMRRTLPYAFTENGVAMLSSVLKSEQAIQVNVAIIRVFTRLRSYLSMDAKLSDRMTDLEEATQKGFKIVFERLDNIENYQSPLPKRKKISLKKIEPNF